MKSGANDHSISWLNLSSNDDTAKCKYVILGEQLGDGNFSVVKECMNLYTKNLFALKMIHKAAVRDKLQLVTKELKLLAEISDKIKELEEQNYSSTAVFDGHHHVLQLYDYFETDDNIALVMQLCNKDDLYEKITAKGHLDLETQVRPYTACLVSVLEFLHGQAIVHRDIKAENVLFRLRVDKNKPLESQVRFRYDLTTHDLILADFGFATKIRSDIPLKEYVGTLSYLAPEIVHCKNVNYISEKEKRELKSYGCPVDIWALGVLTYFMALGYMPFDCDDQNETLDCILHQDYYVDKDVEQNPKMAQFWSFLRMCFNLNDQERATAVELKNHPFIENYFGSTIVNLAHVPSSPHSMKRNASSRSLQAPDKSSSYTDDTCMEICSPLKTSTSHLEPELATSRRRNLTEARSTLRRTLSMTALRKDLLLLADGTRSLKQNSTFVLGEKPPQNSLMNGCYSTSPESLSTEDTVASNSSEPSSTSLGSNQDTKLTKE